MSNKKKKTEDVTSEVTPKPKKDVEQKRWLGQARIKRDGVWYIVVCNLMQDAYACVREGDHPLHTDRDRAIPLEQLNISTKELQQARLETGK